MSAATTSFYVNSEKVSEEQLLPLLAHIAEDRQERSRDGDGEAYPAVGEVVTHRGFTVFMLYLARRSAVAGFDRLVPFGSRRRGHTLEWCRSSAGTSLRIEYLTPAAAATPTRRTILCCFFDIFIVRNLSGGGCQCAATEIVLVAVFGRRGCRLRGAETAAPRVGSGRFRVGSRIHVLIYHRDLVRFRRAGRHDGVFTAAAASGVRTAGVADGFLFVGVIAVDCFCSLPRRGCGGGCTPFFGAG